MSKLLKMQQLEDEDELAYSAEDTTRIHTDGEKHEDGRPSWMKTLHNSASTWLELLPQSLQVLLNPLSGEDLIVNVVFSRIPSSRKFRT